MAELGVGVIGLGRMGWLHAEHLSGTIRGAGVVAAAVDDAHRQQLEATGGAPWPLAADVESLVADPLIDAIVVVSPTSLHHEHIQLAAAHGKAIFAEKPLADSVKRSIETADVVR